jgi:hypothetical protein
MARSAKTNSDKTGADMTGPDRDMPQEVAAEDASVARTDASDLPGADQAADPNLQNDAQPVVAADSLPIIDPAPEVAPEAARDPDRPAPLSSSEPMPATPRVDPAPDPAPARGPAFAGLVMGGIVAAALGYVAAWQGYGLPARELASAPDQTAAIAAQAERITALEADIQALPAPVVSEAPVPPDLGPITDEIAALRTEMSSALMPLGDDLAALKASLATLDDRVSALERTPAPDGTMATTAIAAWDAEIAGLREQIAAQDTRLQSIADEAAARLEAAQTAVSQIEDDASANAMAALQRAAVSRMQAGIDAGTPFDAALGDLSASGIAVPDALAAVAVTGVPTMAELAEAFPDAARVALATAHAEGLADEGEGRIMSFLRRQLGVRSVTPREGTDPDAVLSRAEAAVGEGRLSDSMAEIGALPEVVRAEMAGWMALAEGRVAAVSALQTLSESLPIAESLN